MKRFRADFGMEAIRWAVGVLLCAAATITAGAADLPAGPARLRVAIPMTVVSGADGRATLGEEFVQFTSAWFRERAPECASLELLSQGHCDAIMRELTGGLRRRPADLLAGVRRFQPVEAVVYYMLTDRRKVEIAVATDAGVATTEIDAVPLMSDPQSPPNRALPELVRRTVAWVAGQLPIAEADRRILVENRIPDREHFLAIASSRRIPIPDPAIAKRDSESGLPRLKWLNMFWRLDKPNRALAAEVVRCVCELLLANTEPAPAGHRTPNAWSQRHAKAGWAVMVQSCFQEILGTPDEPLAYLPARTAPEFFARDVLALARPLFIQLDLDLDLNENEEALPGSPAHTLPGARTATREKRLAAIRLLGMLATPDAVAMLETALADPAADLRMAAAFGAANGTLPAATLTKLLRPLLKDANPEAAFWAAAGLRAAGAKIPDLRPLARRVALGTSPAAEAATRILAELATAEDLPQLRSLAATRRESRAALVTALLRLKGGDLPLLREWLDDPDEAVIRTALEAPFDAEWMTVLTPRLLALTDGPFEPLAGPAREVLRRHRPADPWVATPIALRTEHPYIRERLVERIAADADPRAIPLLETASANRDGQVRVTALRALADRDPARARALLPGALADEDQWVAFHAAVLAPQLAVPELVPILKAALGRAADTATRLYLEDAIAKGTGAPPPPPRPAARPLTGERNFAWGTTPGAFADKSPFDAYYCMDTERLDNLARAHAAGKVLVARTAPLRIPARLILDPGTRLDVIGNLDRELRDEAVAILDGVVYGEETMEFPDDALWPEAWSLFCYDAGLDPARVAGRIENLNGFEKRAWTDWTRLLHVRGFNRLYDLTKQRYGKLRPGLQVGTFQGLGVEQKADFGGVYDYKGDSRLCAYDLVRSLKTLYPDRPAIWLSLGIGGYEMNPVHDTDTMPRGPLFETWGRAWSDSITAWLAGADTGWFSVWLFVSPAKGRTDSGMTSLRGKIVWVDDIGTASPELETAIKWAHDYVSVFSEKAKAPPQPGDLAAVEELLDEPDDSRAKGQAALDRDLAARKTAMKLGFLYNQQHVYDCARVFASLPRLRYRAPALVALPDGISVWTRPQTDYPLIPAAALLNRYDCVGNLNLLPSLKLSDYRLVIAHDPPLLRDETIGSITRWLRETPGLLVVHRDLTAANDAEASTVADHDGVLAADWPWEADLRVTTVAVQPGRTTTPVELVFAGQPLPLASGSVSSRFEALTPNVQILATVDGAPVLALWRHPKYRGAVLFDGMQFVSNEYLAELRRAINALCRDAGVGMIVEGPALLETLDAPSLKAAAATRYYNPAKEAVLVPGLDLLSGSMNCAVGPWIGSISGLAASNHVGRYIATTETLTALAEKPFIEARIDGDALVLHCPGVIRLVSATGAVSVSAQDGRPVPVTKTVAHEADTAEFGPDSFGNWLFAADAEGLWQMRRGDLTYYYLRARTPVVVRPAGQPPATADSQARPNAADLEVRAARQRREAEQPAPVVKSLNLDLGAGARMPFVHVQALNAWVGMYEVTSAEYRRFQPTHDRELAPNDDRLPVVRVNYADAEAFAAWVTRVCGPALPAGCVARLPTGDEWLAFARCGDDRRYPWGSTWPPVQGNYHDHVADDGQSLTGAYRDGYRERCPVEASGRNDWGLYGVGGNVWEWTADPLAAAAGWRVRRGAWFGWELWGTQGYELDLRCSHRSYAFPSLRHHGTGFRLVLAPPAATVKNLKKE